VHPNDTRGRQTHYSHRNVDNKGLGSDEEGSPPGLVYSKYKHKLSTLCVLEAEDGKINKVQSLPLGWGISV
jgi:hypothetical protein